MCRKGKISKWVAWWVIKWTNPCSLFILRKNMWTSLVIQWLRTCLPKQGTWIWSLVQEDFTCSGATKPMNPQLLSLSSRPHELQLPSPWRPCSTVKEATAMRSPCTPSRESPHAVNEDQVQSKINQLKKYSTYYMLCYKKKRTGTTEASFILSPIYSPHTSPKLVYLVICNIMDNFYLICNFV